MSIKAYTINTNNKLYILCRYKDKYDKLYYLKIFNLDKSKLEYKLPVSHKDVIG